MPDQPETQSGLQRLQKILASAGVTSRRKAEQLILDGRVEVNGATVTELGSKADPARDHIRVDGKLLHGPERLRYFVLNKPRGFVTTVSDPENRPTIMQFFEGARGVGSLPRLYPVGRLDFHSEGLLLMTNDGELAHRLTSAASKVEKTYLVKVSGEPTESALDQLRSGIIIDRNRDGAIPGARASRVKTAPCLIRRFRSGDNPWFEVKLIEGRNRQIRKMFEEIGNRVEKIRRIGYGPLVLDQTPGNFRELEAHEVEALQRAVTGTGPRRTAPIAPLGKNPPKARPSRPKPAKVNAARKKSAAAPRRTPRREPE